MFSDWGHRECEARWTRSVRRSLFRRRGVTDNAPWRRVHVRNLFAPGVLRFSHREPFARYPSPRYFGGRGGRGSITS